MKKNNITFIDVLKKFKTSDKIFENNNIRDKILLSPKFTKQMSNLVQFILEVYYKIGEIVLPKKIDTEDSRKKQPKIIATFKKKDKDKIKLSKVTKSEIINDKNNTFSIR